MKKIQNCQKIAISTISRVTVFTVRKFGKAAHRKATNSSCSRVTIFREKHFRRSCYSREAKIFSQFVLLIEIKNSVLGGSFLLKVKKNQKPVKKLSQFSLFEGLKFYCKNNWEQPLMQGSLSQFVTFVETKTTDLGGGLFL